VAPEGGVPDGVDASMDAMQPLGLDAVSDRAGTDPERVQLRERDDPALAGG